MPFGRQRKPNQAAPKPANRDRGYTGPLPVLGPDPDAHDTLVADKREKEERMRQGALRSEEHQRQRIREQQADGKRADDFARIARELEAKKGKEQG